MSIASYVRQKELVKEHLRAHGSCTYTDFDPRIRKLDGVINELKKQGWKIETQHGGEWRIYRCHGEPEVSVFPGDKPKIIEPQERLFDDN